MKYLSALLVVASLTASAVSFAADEVAVSEENNNTALSALCETYAVEDGIAANEKADYLKDCLSNMTDLSENVQEGLPVTADNSSEALTTPTAEKTNHSPETLVQNELVETPDPAAEQLSAGK
jgi:RecG-like helicase